jgi:hypothetical protein
LMAPGAAGAAAAGSAAAGATVAGAAAAGAAAAGAVVGVAHAERAATNIVKTNNKFATLLAFIFTPISSFLVLLYLIVYRLTDIRYYSFIGILLILLSLPVQAMCPCGG